MSNHTSNSTTDNTVEHPSQSHTDHLPKEGGVASSGDMARSSMSNEGLGHVLQEADSTTLDHGNPSDKETISSNSAGEISGASDRQADMAGMELECAQTRVGGMEEIGRPKLHGSEATKESSEEESANGAGGSVAVLETGQYVTDVDQSSKESESAVLKPEGDASNTGGTAQDSKGQSVEQFADNVSENGSCRDHMAEGKTDINGNEGVACGIVGNGVGVANEATSREDDVSMETGEASNFEPTGVKKEEAESVEEAVTSEVGGIYDVVEGGVKLKVIDEGEWVVVDHEGSADMWADDRTQSAGEPGRNVVRPSKRSRSENEAETQSDPEPVAKQSRVEEKEAGGVAEELPEERPRVQSDPEIREGGVVTAEETESSYKEAATGQVEQVEGNLVTVN